VDRARARGAIVLFHRGHEHSGRVGHLVDELDLPDFEFFAWDARGHGRSPGARGYSPSVATSVQDVQTFVDHVAWHHGVAMKNIAVVGQSLAGALLAAWAHDYAPGIRAMVLAAPAFRVKLYLPFARPVLRLAQAVRGNFFVDSYVKANYLTHDPARIASFESDPWVTRAISVNVLLGLHALSKRIVADAEAITVPTQLLMSGRDYVVAARPQNAFYERLGALSKERHVLKGFYHDTLGEKHRAHALEKVRRFLLERFDVPLERPSLLAADETGFTRREADELARPLALFSPRGLYWRFMRLGLRLAGRLSDGVRLGTTTGFDSGRSLDYVYRNVASGRTRIGQAIDRLYLDAIGWKGIRQRKLHVEALIRKAVERVQRERRPARILDVAAGAGRYVLDAIDDTQLPESIVLRDYSDANVMAGRALIRERGLEKMASFVAGDAFDREQLASLVCPFTVGVVSGLYELYPDNDAVRRSLDGLAAAIEDGGYLIYTGQPWHPQLELIARVLTSHRRGSAWIMRRRTQAELDQLVAAAGFVKVAQRIDEWGMFTVSLARKTGSAIQRQADRWGAPALCARA
jgi:alpha-beta hydrolase superfamily lysophospholipase/SAM-dependent methyltransferase